MHQQGPLKNNGEINGYAKKKEKRTLKYHQAAYTYVFVGIIYLIVFYVTMPSHNFPVLLESFVNNNMAGVSNILEQTDYSIIVKGLAVSAGMLFLSMSYFIYKEFKSLTIILVVFYGIRFLGATLALFSENVFLSVKYILPLIAITFYMLARAAFNFKP